MEWFVDDPHRGRTALTVIVLVAAAAGIWFGRKRLALAIPVSLVFLLLAAFAIPSAIPARPASQRNACIFNLRAIQDAKTEWARANNKLTTDIPTEVDLYGMNGTGGILRHRPDCPRGGIYTIGAVNQNPTCTFSNKGHRLP
jgi:hypothetical protein